MIREPHHLSTAWLALSPLAILGTILNTLILIVFIKERRALISSVNAMTWYHHIQVFIPAFSYCSMNTVFRLWVTLVIHWRSVEFFCWDSELCKDVTFLGNREMVEIIQWFGSQGLKVNIVGLCCYDHCIFIWEHQQSLFLRYDIHHQVT